MTPNTPIEVTAADREACIHGVRWPHPCTDCFDADFPPGKSLTEHPCYGLFASAPTELSHRAYVTKGEPMYCERCGTELDQCKKQKPGTVLSWAPRQQAEARATPLDTGALREEVARLVCSTLDSDPDTLEAGDAYGIDAYLPNGDPAHRIWRQYETLADAILNLVQPMGSEREDSRAGQWRRDCDACEGEGKIERGDMPLHRLHSEAPEYATTDCGECDGEGYRWTDALVSLAECPIGLFWHGETLCLKTEYGNNEGRIDAYIVESGEFYWGDAPQSIANQRAGLVLPVEHDFAAEHLARKAS